MPRTLTEEKARPTCKLCKSRKVMSLGNSKSKHGFTYWRTMCAQCYERPYVAHKKAFCELCGFKAVHLCQLDIDHIDGNHANNDVVNLQTLCANCHRLKTYVNADWEKKGQLAPKDERD